jgi:PAS domain S-box-containing protein
MPDVVPDRAASSGVIDPREDVRRRAALLEAVAFAAERLSRAPSWDDAIEEALERIGLAAEVRRASLCENVEQESSGRGAKFCHEWSATSGKNAGDDDGAPAWRSHAGFERWAEELRSGRAVHGSVDTFPPEEREELARQGITSTAAVPVFVGPEWWGHLSLDETARRRRWSDADIEALRAAAAIIGAALDRRLAEEERADTEDRYQRLVERSPLGIVVHQQGRLVFANPAAAALLGASEPKELVGRSVLQFIHETSRPTVLARLQRLREGYDVPPQEEKLVRLDGSTVVVEATASALVVRGQHAVQVVIRDLSPDKRVARQLRTHSAYLEALHETTLGLIKRLDPQELLEAIVTRAASLVGTEHGYVYQVEPGDSEMEVRVGIGAFTDWKGYRLGRRQGAAGRVWQTGDPLVVVDYDTWEGRSATFPKGLFHAVVCVPLRSAGEVVGVLGLAHVEAHRAFGPEDVSILGRFAELASVTLDNARLYTEAQQELVARRKAEQALRFQAHLLDTVENAVVATGGGDAITYWNDFARRLLGWRQDEVLGKRFRDVVPVPQDVIEQVNRTTEEGGTWAGDFELSRRDGSIFIAFAKVSPIKGPAGSVEGLIGVLIDVTERRRAEEALRASLQREKEVSRRLIALDEMKTTFLEAVSHELRNPLAVILGVALTLERPDVELSEGRAHQLVDKLAGNARKLDRLLSDLLDLDRLSRGIMQPRLRPTDVSALVRQVLAGNDVSSDRSIRLVLSDVIVPAEPAKVERIVENLVANAVRHTPEGTPIWVRVESVSEGAVIAVEDAGPGVPAHLHDAIFEAFRQGTEGRRTSPGVGIGLSLVARFAELHGGRAWVEDRPGGGASFKVFLPSEPPSSTASAS